MKKYFALLTVILLGFSLNQAVAQNTATVNVNLTAVQSIIVDNATNAVNIAIATPADYANGKATLAIANHLQASSTQLFTISASASGNFTTGVITDDIPLTALTITPAFGSSTLTLTGQVYTPATNMVANTPQAIIKSGSGSTDAKFSVMYGISAGLGGANLVNRPAGTYAATITYTIAAL